MKKAFDANVSRLKPRTRLGALLARDEAILSMPAETVESIAQQVADESNDSLKASLKQRIVAHSEKPTAQQALQKAISAETDFASVHAAPTPSFAAPVVSAPAPAVAPAAKIEAEPASRASAVVEHTAPPAERREKLKERLKAVRENPRPEPLPDTVAEAGVLAVERIAALQTELTRVRAVNLALTQDLEAVRRQAERATEEARTRMDEARRLATEMEGRAALLADLEGELASLEAERNEALLSLQDSRQKLDASAAERAVLQQQVTEKETEIEECLAEEERLAGAVESAQRDLSAAQRANAVLKTERDTLARQVSDLTRERAELLDARKALEAVHRALSQAVSK
jgi:DNA repair exonuclease SbcCD ATPase subunit